jgi:hypothetical protein
MPDIPVVGTATVGAPGVTRKPILLITGQPLFHLSYRCNLVGAGSRALTRILRHTEATLGIELCRLNFSSTDTSSTSLHRSPSGA